RRSREIDALVFPKAQLRADSSGDRPSRRGNMATHRAVDVRDMARRIRARVDPSEDLTLDAGVRRELRVDEDVTVGRCAVSRLDVRAGATDRPDLAIVEVGRPRPPDEVDIAGDGAIARVDAPAPQQRVLEAEDIRVTHDASVARLEPQRLGLRTAFR